MVCSQNARKRRLVCQAFAFWNVAVTCTESRCRGLQGTEKWLPGWEDKTKFLTFVYHSCMASPVDLFHLPVSTSMLYLELWIPQTTEASVLKFWMQQEHLGWWSNHHPPQGLLKLICRSKRLEVSPFSTILEIFGCCPHAESKTAWHLQSPSCWTLFLSKFWVKSVSCLFISNYLLKRVQLLNWIDKGVMCNFEFSNVATDTKLSPVVYKVSFTWWMKGVEYLRCCSGLS